MSREHSLYSPESEASADWQGDQDELARSAVQYGAANSSEIKARLERSGIAFFDVNSVADLAAIDMLLKDDLPELQAADPPFGGMLAVPAHELLRIYRSPGPITDPEGDAPDFWRLAPAVWAAGFRRGDVVLNTFSYHLTPGGHMLDSGFREVGCVVIPGGVGNKGGQMELAASTAAPGYGGTPQFLLQLLLDAEEAGVGLRFERALVTGAPLPPGLRAQLQDGYGVDVFQSYGTADAGTLGYECLVKEGWHVAPGVVIEVVDPASGRPVAEDEAGEVVVTSPNLAYPLVRFGTGDLSAFNFAPCECGRTTPRLVGFLGRVGEGVKVRGMFVHPRQLARALTNDPRVARYQAVVTGEARTDRLTVTVELAEGASVEGGALAQVLEAEVQLGLEVVVVDKGTLPNDAPPLVDRRKL